MSQRWPGTVRVLAVGKLKSRQWLTAQQDYASRVARYVDFKLVEVKDYVGKLPDAQAVQKEGEALLAAGVGLPRMVLLSEHGPTYTSPQLAEWLAQQLTVYGGLGLIIGGPVGVSAGVQAACAGQLSLSPLTMPHEMARVVLLEQLYRAFTILGGEGYHKAG